MEYYYGSSVCFDDDFWNNFNFNEPYTFTNVLVSVENSLSHRTFHLPLLVLEKSIRNKKPTKR